MILIEKTVKELGYSPDDLSEKSSKDVWVQCDYCKKEYKSIPKRLNKGLEIVSKHACWDCRHLKREDINIIKYGVKNNFQRKECQEKSKKTLKEKYGVEHPMLSEEIKKKVETTCEEKYGVSNPLLTKEVQEKIKKTNLERYGCENASSNEKVKEKRKETCREKFGSDYFMSSEEGQKRLQEGVMEKYGVENVFQNEEIKEKIRQTNNLNYGVNYPNQNRDFLNQHIHKTLRANEYGPHIVKEFSGLSIPEWAKKIGYSRSYFSKLIAKHGFDEAVKLTPYISELEQSFSKWLDDEGIIYETQVCYEKKRWDFVIDDWLGIEMGGVFYHSDYHDPYRKNKSRHRSKQEIGNKNGVTTLFFWDSEWNTKPDVVKSIILNKLGQSHRIFARKCSKTKISKEDANSFFENNHLMGKGVGETYALIHNGKIVSAMCLKKKKDNEWEISRFSNKLNTSVVGSFSRLLSFFEKDRKPDSLITFVDKRYGSGEYLPNFGFTEDSCYLSFSWTNGHDIVHRMKFPSNSGYEKGWYKLWDCGQQKYRKTY